MSSEERTVEPYLLASTPSDASTLVLRLIRFRPLRNAFDRVLRDVVLPDLLAAAGVLDVRAGRKGPDETGSRVIASLWSSPAAMDAVMGEDLERLRFHPELVPETTDRHLEVCSVEFAIGTGAVLGTGILRVARGELVDRDVSRYAEEVKAGIEADLDAGHGPACFILGAATRTSFVSVSAWSDWSVLERATGSSVSRPIHTQPIESIDRFTVQHLEVLPIG